MVQRLKASACNVGDLGSIPGSGKSPGEGNSNPLQYSGLENLTDRGAWQSTGSQRVRHNQKSNTFTFQAKPAQTHLARIILTCEIADIIKLSIDYRRQRRKVGRGTFVLLNLRIDVTEETNGQDVQCQLSIELRDRKSVKVMWEMHRWFLGVEGGAPYNPKVEKSRSLACSAT